VSVLQTLQVGKRDRKDFKKEVLANFCVVKRRRHRDLSGVFVPEPFPARPLPPFRTLVREHGPCREDLVPLPPRLQMPEHRLYYHVQKHYHDRRSAEALRQIVSATDQLHIAAERQKQIVDEQSKIMD